MNPMDEQTVQNIWSRVQGKASASKGAASPAEAKPGFDQMALQMAQLVGHYQNVVAAMPREKRQLLQQMIRQGQEYIGVLNGLCRLHTGTKPAMPPRNPVKIPRTEHFRYCLGLQQHLIQACSQYDGDKRFGYIFRQMAKNLENHSSTILRLLGDT